MSYYDDLDFQEEQARKRRMLGIAACLLVGGVVLVLTLVIIISGQPMPVDKNKAIAVAPTKTRERSQPSRRQPTEEKPVKGQPNDDLDEPVIVRRPKGIEGTMGGKDARPSTTGLSDQVVTNPYVIPEILDRDGKDLGGNIPSSSERPPIRSELEDWKKRRPDKSKNPENTPDVEEKEIAIPGIPINKKLSEGYETRGIQGFTMLLSTQAIKEAKKENGKPFEALLVEFDNLAKAIPPWWLAKLRRVKIFVEWDNIDRQNPQVLAKYYGGNVWLLDRSENPLKSHSVEILSLKKLAEEKARTVERSRLILLHELSHAVHHNLQSGFENQAVSQTYKQAMDRRLYDRVQNDEGSLGPAYARTNSAEYFAELSCAYLDRCKWFPFDREELREHDSSGYSLMEKVWGKKSPKRPTPASTSSKVK